ncbi:MAG: DUF1674 domain-containing protein [Xanthomonadales bacterium]|nr:DUF1674 domain-containing protein [Xanthomonadales bacterium]
MSELVRHLPRAGASMATKLARVFKHPRPCGWEVGSARWQYDEMGPKGGVDATRYGDWEYSGRCTDF